MVYNVYDIATNYFLLSRYTYIRVLTKIHDVACRNRISLKSHSKSFQKEKNNNKIKCSCFFFGIIFIS